MPALYSIILADPPWEYRNYRYAQTKTGNVARRGARKEYHTMADDDLLAMPVHALAASNAVLFLWATWPRLPVAVECMRAWGFTYYSIGFLWVKTTINDKLHWGMGKASRANTEPCLLWQRGKGVSRQSASVHSVVASDPHHTGDTIIAPVMRHSAKPPEVRDRIVQLYGNVPRVELFARDRAPGWDVFGDEIDSDWVLQDAGWYYTPTGILLPRY